MSRLVDDSVEFRRLVKDGAEDVFLRPWHAEHAALKRVVVEACFVRHQDDQLSVGGSNGEQGLATAVLGVSVSLGDSVGRSVVQDHRNSVKQGVRSLPSSTIHGIMKRLEHCVTFTL